MGLYRNTSRRIGLALVTAGMTTSMVVVTAGTGLVGCKKKDAATDAAAPAGETQQVAQPEQATATVVTIDGSSTVFPITEAVAEDFQRKHKAHVTIGVSGTGGGFKKFCSGEVVITGASRPIKPSEVTLCQQHNVNYIELPIAYDGIAIAVHSQNTWVDYLTVAELQMLWRPEAQGKITHWDQIRNTWPHKEIHLFGAGVDSGTYDYFTKAIVGEEHASRGDYTASEDDNILVQGISTDPLALGFFGYAYLAENKDKLKGVPVVPPSAIVAGAPATGLAAKAVAASVETIRNSTYQPLSRPIFIYVSAAAANKAEVANFVNFYLNEGRALVEEVGYVPLPEQATLAVRKRFDARVLGSVFEGKGATVGATIEQLLGKP